MCYQSTCIMHHEYSQKDSIINQNTTMKCNIQWNRTNPELSSCRDADKMIGFVSSRSRRAEIGEGKNDGCAAVSQTLLITRYDPVRAEAEETLAITDMKELLGLPVIGVIPESKDVLTCTNLGKPIISLGEENPAAGAYME